MMTELDTAQLLTELCEALEVPSNQIAWRSGSRKRKGRNEARQDDAAKVHLHKWCAPSDQFSIPGG